MIRGLGNWGIVQEFFPVFERAGSCQPSMKYCKQILAI